MYMKLLNKNMGLRFIWIILITPFISAFLCPLYPNIRVNAVGDIMMGTLFPERVLPPNNGKSLFTSTEEYLHYGSPDFIFGNLEGAVTNYNHTTKDISTGRAYAFEMPPSYVEYLKEAGFNIVSTANNHARDFGERGYEDTRKFLSEAGIAAIGSRDEIKYFNIRGTKVAWIGFSWFSYSNNILDSLHSVKIIREAASKSDVVIVSVHAGAEGEKALHIRDANEYFYGENRGNIMKFAHLAIASGADLVLGHSPHVPRAMELYRDRLIIYSLGNFTTYGVFSTTGDKKLVPILHVEMDDSGRFIRGRIIPFIQREYGVYKGIPYYDSTGRVIKLIKKLTSEDIKDGKLIIESNGEIAEKKNDTDVADSTDSSGFPTSVTIENGR